MSSPTAVAVEPPPTTGGVRRAERLLRAREIGIALAIVVVFGLTYFKNHSFGSSLSIQQLLNGAAIIALLGVGETLVIITRNVDLSVGAVLGLSAYLVGDLFVHHPHTPVILGFALGIGVGLLIGVINGVIVTVTRVPSLVVTLAALYIIRGVDAQIVHGKQIDPTSIPKAFQTLGYDTVLGVPWLALIVAALVLIVGYAMRSFRSARDLYAIGSNPEAAALAGVPAGKRVFTAFVISGALAGLGGALFVSEFATPTTWTGPRPPWPPPT